MIVYILREDGSPRSLAEIERDIMVIRVKQLLHL
jgi:hypothetical protein